MNRNTINFGAGILLGSISIAMWNYSQFLYYTVWCVQTIIIYILINYEKQQGTKR